MTGSTGSTGSSTLARRRVLGLGAAGVAGLVATSCDALSTHPVGEQAGGDTGGGSSSGGAADRSVKEAPQLAKLVKAGRLPPLKERLPVEPLVVQPVSRPGVYGGDLRVTQEDVGTADPMRQIGYDFLVRWNLDFTKVIPSVAKSFRASADAREYTFELREGMRWSDGEPFTADDVLFAYKDVLLNPKLRPDVPEWLTAGGRPATVEKRGDYEVVFSFAAPNGLFLQEMATPSGGDLVAWPKHYMKQFHADYNDKVQGLVDREKVKDWAALFDEKGGVDGIGSIAHWRNPDLPVVAAWKVVVPMGEGSPRYIVDRNPYYWKVDSDGRQLPYIDRVVTDLISTSDAMVLKAAHGDVDYDLDNFTDLAVKPVLARSRRDGGYGFYDQTSAVMNLAMIALNLTHENPTLREIFQNKDFRIGLSLAMDRKEIIRAAYLRAGKPWQGAPRSSSDFYVEKLATQYTEHDMAAANRHLDRAGYAKRDSEGIRLGPDGKPISFTLEYPPEGDAAWSDAFPMIVDSWRKAGVRVQLKTEDVTLFSVRTGANKHDAAVWRGEGGLGDGVLVYPRWYLPFDSGSYFAVPWAEWHASGGSAGEEPPEAVRAQLKLFDRVRATGDPKEQVRLMRQVMEMAVEQFYVIGLALPTQTYGLVKDTLHNVVDPMLYAWQYPSPGPSNPQQWFFE